MPRVRCCPEFTGKSTTRLRRLQRLSQPGNKEIGFDKYFDEYAGGQEYSRSFKDYFCEEWTCDLIEAVWGRRPPYKLLDCGSANGLTLAAFAKIDVDAWGVENNEYIHSQTSEEMAFAKSAGRRS